MNNSNPILLESNLSDLKEVASKLLFHASNQKIWLFDGEMGVGKTTLIKSICKQLGVKDHVTSPTFSLVNEYLCMTGEKIYHFDYYLPHHQTAMWYAEFESYYNQNCYCFVEWPQKLSTLMLGPYFHIELTKNNDDSRTVKGLIK